MANFLTIEETKEVVLKWIHSCETMQQLNLCKEIVDAYIRQRYQFYSSEREMAMILHDLDCAMLDQKDKIIVGVYEHNNQLTTID